MSFLSKALKSAAAVKVIDVARREAAKPENQRKVRDAASKISERLGKGRPGR